MVKNLINEIEGSCIFERDTDICMRLEGVFSDAVRFIERNQICDVANWQKFVDIFRKHEDGAGNVWVSWRSEFWGKMMRGASMVLKYTHDEGMYKILEASVRDILSTEDELGRISGYSLDDELTKWDIWGRKYVMLGMMYFMEICDDEQLISDMIASMRRQADYLLERIGDGKLDIRTCSKHWEGMNSCSVLEPIVRLYRLTAEKKYLEFAEYIISTGFIQSANIIELAYADRVAPHEYPVVKAYEMMSCFEGLLQYYCVTGIEKYKTAVLNFGRRILEGEISIIGCCGCTHELFDHTSVKQTRTDWNGIMQETCVTVTWIKLAAALLELSGDVRYADSIERSFYNAYLGSLNIRRVPFSEKSQQDVPQVLPFDSYSPLIAGTRGRRVGGYGIFSDGTFYGCCACIGAAGSGIIPQFAVMHGKNSVVLNYYEKGKMTTLSPCGNKIDIAMDTAYPYDGRISIALHMAKTEKFALSLRIPSWCCDACITVHGERINVPQGYATIEREWCDGDTVELYLPMSVERVLPPSGADNEDIYAAYRRGPIVLAADKRITDPDAVLDIKCDKNGIVEGRLAYCNEIPEHRLCLEVELENGEKIRLIDYASAGKTWGEDSRMAAWLRRK